MIKRSPTIPPSLRSQLNDDEEINVFQKFQFSGSISQVLPGPEMVTEYDQENSKWFIPAAK